MHDEIILWPLSAIERPIPTLVGVATVYFIFGPPRLEMSLIRFALGYLTVGGVANLVE